jgi:hypothetical protein
MNTHNALRVEASSTRTLQPEINSSQSLLLGDQPEVRQPDFKVVKEYGYRRFAGYDKKVLHTDNGSRAPMENVTPDVSLNAAICKPS